LGFFACAQTGTSSNQDNLTEQDCRFEVMLVCPDGQTDGCLSGETTTHRCVEGPPTCSASKSCAAQAMSYCLAPGATPQCDDCQMASSPCASDDECGAENEGFICEPVVCACSPADTRCVPGCHVDDDCGEGQICGEHYRCSGAPCEASEDCPSNFDCVEQSCTRRACNKNSECDEYCVEGACYSEAGKCQQMPS
jgi:hypothetical protein